MCAPAAWRNGWDLCSKEHRAESGPEMAGRLTDRHVFALIPEDYRRLDWAQGTER